MPFCMNVLLDFFERLKVLILDSFYLKLKHYWKNKAFFASFCMVGNNPSDCSVLFFRQLQRHLIFRVTLVAKQKFNLQGKKVTENKVKSVDYGFNTFYVSSLTLVKKQWSFDIIHMLAALEDLGKTLSTKFSWQARLLPVLLELSKKFVCAKSKKTSDIFCCSMQYPVQRMAFK